ncbi:MAG: 50S ribosomal protein L17 [Patescibacteria group bacterium]
MRHRKKGKKFNRKTGQKRSFLRNLASDLIRVGKIETTESRAKAIRPVVEKLVTIAKKGTLASRRLVISRIHNQKVVKKLFEEIAPKYVERKGGYLRITKLGKPRKRDGAATSKIEFV